MGDKPVGLHDLGLSNTGVTWKSSFCAHRCRKSGIWGLKQKRCDMNMLILVTPLMDIFVSTENPVFTQMLFALIGSFVSQPSMMHH